MNEDEIRKHRQYEADNLMWHRIEDELPKELEYVLLSVEYYEDEPEVIQGYLEKSGRWFILDPQRDGLEPTHWMPLPSPAEEWNVL
jgi:hypothetical protein